MTLMDWLAVYAAVVATAVAVWDAVKWRREQARLVVECFLAKMVGHVCVPSGGTLHTGEPEAPEEDARRPRFVVFEIKNTGGKPVTVSSVGGRYKRGTHFILMGGVVKLPHTLSPGESLRILTPPGEPEVAAVSEFWVTDGVGKNWPCSTRTVLKQWEALPQVRDKP